MITGATGLLGRQVLKAFERRDWTAKGTGLSRADGATILKVDLASTEEVEKALDHFKYTTAPPLPPTCRSSSKALLTDMTNAGLR